MVRRGVLEVLRSKVYLEGVVVWQEFDIVEQGVLSLAQQGNTVLGEAWMIGKHQVHTAELTTVGRHIVDHLDRIDRHVHLQAFQVVLVGCPGRTFFFPIADRKGDGNTNDYNNSL